MGQTLVIKRGFDRSWSTTLQNDGIPTPYPDDAVLDASVWSGNSSTPLFAPAATWISAAGGTVQLSVLAAQTAGLPTGTYRLQLGITSGGVRSPGFDGQLEIDDAPGTSTAREPYISNEDMELYYDQLDKVQNFETDEAAFLGQRVNVSDDFDRDLINRYDPRAGFVKARNPDFDPVLGYDVPDPSIAPPTKAQLTAWLAAGGLIVDHVAGEILARRAIALILDRQETDTTNPYRDEAQKQRDRADFLWKRHMAQISSAANGTADWLIGRDCTFLPTGAKP